MLTQFIYVLSILYELANCSLYLMMSCCFFFVFFFFLSPQFQFLNRCCQLFMTLWFLLIMFLYPSFGLFYVNPSLNWEYRICFGSLLSSKVFKWPAHLSLHQASISYMPGSLDFSRLNLFRICCHYLTFSILCKWHTRFDRKSLGIHISALYRRVERTMMRYIAHLVFMSLLTLTYFLCPLKILAALDVHVSSSASSLLLTVKPRYLNLLTLALSAYLG